MSRDLSRSTSPFVFDVGPVLREGTPQPFHRVGDAPERIGAEMIGVPEGTEVTVDGYITPLGAGVLIDADVKAPVVGSCVRCLGEVTDDLEIHVSQVFSAGDGLIVDLDGNDEDLEEDAPDLIGDFADLTQSVIDEAVVALPFNPTCEGVGDGSCEAKNSGVPAPDGISGEEERPADPRWAALAEKFGADGSGLETSEDDK